MECTEPVSIPAHKPSANSMGLDQGPRANYMGLDK